MVLTRYTIDGKGIFRTLQNMFNEVDMSVADEQELFDAQEEFERDMSVPDICTNKDVKTTCWFTEEGLAHFDYSLDTLMWATDMYLGKQIEKKCIEYTGTPLYLDEYQAVLAA